MITLDCAYEPYHQHSYPEDWEFAGPVGTDPRADSRWRPTTYTYLDSSLRHVWLTQTPLCDDQAIDEFTRWGKDGAAYLQAKRPDGTIQLVDWQYDRATDTVYPLGG